MNKLQLTRFAALDMPGGHGGYYVIGHGHSPAELIDLADKEDRERLQASIRSLGNFVYRVEEGSYSMVGEHMVFLSDPNDGDPVTRILMVEEPVPGP